MTAEILAFGIAKEIIGGASVEVPIEEGLPVGSLKARLQQQFPRLKDLKSFMIAVNGGYAAPDTVLCQGDEIAIIPPVSGG